MSDETSHRLSRIVLDAIDALEHQHQEQIASLRAAHPEWPMDRIVGTGMTDLILGDTLEPFIYTEFVCLEHEDYRPLDEPLTWADAYLWKVRCMTCGKRLAPFEDENEH